MNNSINRKNIYLNWSCMEFFFGALLFNFSSIEYAFSTGICAKFASASKLFPIHEAVFPKNEIHFIFTKKNLRKTM